MPIFVDDEMVETVTAALLGGITVDDGPTDEQFAVLGAIVAHMWERPDIDLRTLTPLSVEQSAARITDHDMLRRTNELLVVLELSRHPQTAAQIERVEAFSAACGCGGPDLEIVRRWAEEGAERATADYDRFYEDKLGELSEPTLRDTYLHLDAPDLELAARLRKLQDLPEGTLGRAYLSFYERNNLTLPGDDTHLPAHYVSHDMNHTITAYEPTGPGEIALGAFTLAMNDNSANWIQFLTNLLIHEAGMLKHGEIMPKSQTLTREGATELLGEALRRGSQCTGDFSQADHLAMADWQLEDVRAHFNVPPIAVPMF